MPIFEPQERPDDIRLKHIIARADGNHGLDVGIVGVPFDFGVKLSGGRTGARDAPDAIRLQLKKYGTVYNIERGTDISRLSIADFGNVRVRRNETRGTHDRITAAVCTALVSTRAVIVLGGGNDITYASVKALSKTFGLISGMNVDAHLDVRPVVNNKRSSGTPYRCLIDEGHLRADNFWEVAIQGHINSYHHVRWLRAKGGHIVYLSDIRKKGTASVAKKILSNISRSRTTFVSVDIDSVAQAFAPGSSAPSPDGLFPEDILTLSFLAGKNPNVKLFEIMEVNPAYDIDARTCRLAANMIHEFLSGFSLRNRKT